MDTVPIIRDFVAFGVGWYSQFVVQQLARWMRKRRAKHVFSTVRDGNWSDPTIWTGGVVPGLNELDKVRINHLIKLDTDVELGPRGEPLEGDS